MVRISIPTQFSIQAYLIVGLQITISLLLTLLGIYRYGSHAGFSFGCGGLAVILPNVYFAIKLFNNIQFKDSKTHLYNFYSGQIIKFFLSIFLSILMIFVFHVELMPFIIGFLFTQLSIFFVPPLTTLLRLLSFKL